jgi:hypothetical protein
MRGSEFDGSVELVPVLHRWLTPAGFAVILLVVLANAGGGVGYGTSGRSLILTIGAAVYALASAAFLLWRTAPTAPTVALLLVMGAAATVIHHGDPDGPSSGSTS